MKLMLFAPELLLLLGSLALFFMTTGKVGGKKARSFTLTLAIANIFLCFACLHNEGMLFFDAYKIDFFSQALKICISLGFAIVLLFSTELKGIKDEVRPEYYLFMLMSTIGLIMMVSSVELLSMFIALELSSYSLYLLVPMREDRAGLRMQMESAIKYIMFGVVATGIMLFGMSYLFGLTGTTYFSELIPAMHGLMGNPAAIVAVVMVLGGFLYKLGVFPLHFWVPDVYQGASNETTAFISSVPKIAAVAMLVRILALVTPEGKSLVTLLMVLSVCSMFYGNLVALVQTDIKRMLGFSGIAHAGYVLLGLITLQDSGYATSLYYITGYLLMNLACFLVICQVAQDGENLAIDDLSGLHQRSPLLALTLAVGMFALAGIPPFVGFMGKFMLLTGALKQGYLLLVILAAINTAISIYYYLSVVRVAYCNSPEQRPEVVVGGITKSVSLALVVIIIALGIAPNQIIQIATDVVRTIQ
ncbi:MAG: NADH-quinone oxidoreductase subunit N [Desulfobulbaceae bacterium]|nr:NADH-quinone oxidoreductase subunit N [Desulfobulbaceae bacterium]HIJ77702.1 NADH-quinone oxidoreductase subunit N [Deltaproteobacteria bacterium]